MKKFYSLIVAAAAVTFSAVASQPATVTNLERSIQRLDIQTKKAVIGESLTNSPARVTLADTEEWKSLGTASYTDGFLGVFFTLPQTTWDVEVQESATTPGYYRMVNPYGLLLEEGAVANDIYIHAEDPERVYIETQSLGINFGYGVTYVSSDAAYELNDGKTADEVAEMGLFGTLENGNITFPAKALLVAMANYNNGSFYYANQSGEFRLVLPGGKDYTVALEASACSADNKVPFTVTLGSDVAKAVFATVNGAYVDDPELFEIIPTISQTAIASGSYTVNLTKEGRSTIFVVGLDAEGNVVGGKTAPVFGIFDNDDQWEALGEGEYTEVIIAENYNNISTVTYKVPVDESKTTPGLYRVVDAYSSVWPYYNEQFAHSGESHKHYIYIDATNPDRVLIREYPLGVDMGYGDAILESFANYQIELGVDPELPALQSYYGTCKDGVVTFPSKSLLFSETKYNNNGKYYAPDGFNVKLPTSGVAAIESEDSNAPVEYFNLQGMKVERPEAGGLYITRQANTVRKVIVK